jgi:hypothetical protein
VDPLRTAPGPGFARKPALDPSRAPFDAGTEIANPKTIAFGRASTGSSNGTGSQELPRSPDGGTGFVSGLTKRGEARHELPSGDSHRPCSAETPGDDSGRRRQPVRRAAEAGRRRTPVGFDRAQTRVPGAAWVGRSRSQPELRPAKPPKDRIRSPRRGAPPKRASRSPNPRRAGHDVRARPRRPDRSDEDEIRSCPGA